MTYLINVVATPLWGVSIASKSRFPERRTAPWLQRFLSTAIVATALVSSGDAFAQTTPYPQQQRTKTTAPAKTAARQTRSAPNTFSKTQTAKTQTRTSQSQIHQAKKEHGHGYSHGGGEVGFGVGATIDLGGIGQRRAEPDPFAVPASPPPVATRTKGEPPRAKKPREVEKSDPFTGVQLTGEQAKEQSSPR